MHLASDGEYSLHGLAMHSHDHFWSRFTDLELAVREGASVAFGRKTEEPVQVPRLGTFVGTLWAYLPKGPTGAEPLPCPWLNRDLLETHKSWLV